MYTICWAPPVRLWTPKVRGGMVMRTFAGADVRPDPASLAAVTAKMYVPPFVRPVTVWLSAVVDVLPLVAPRHVTAYVTCEPAALAGADQCSATWWLSFAAWVIWGAAGATQGRTATLGWD